MPRYRKNVLILNTVDFIQFQICIFFFFVKVEQISADFIRISLHKLCNQMFTGDEFFFSMKEN